MYLTFFFIYMKSHFACTEININNIITINMYCYVKKTNEY